MGQRIIGFLKFLVLLLLIVNIGYLDWKLFTNSASSSSTPVLEAKPSPPLLQDTSSKSEKVCSQSCLSAIYQATSSSQVSPKTNQTAPLTSTGVKEYFVPFGGATMTAIDWQDAPGLQAYIDTANYSRIKSVTFEASVHVPTGNETANVRLFNVTDKHPVWFSEVFFNGGSNSQLLLSQPITLDPGNKLYKVQFKTQLQFPAVLDQSRLHIVIY